MPRWSKKVGKAKKTVFFASITLGTGEVTTKRLPFQSSKYKNIEVLVLDTDGDGTTDAVAVKGKKGKNVKQEIIDS